MSGAPRRVPIVATIVVALAVATMIALGVWQLARMREKAHLRADYQRAYAMSAEIAWPRDPAAYAQALYRRATVTCAHVDRIDSLAGHSQTGETGWATYAHCRLADGGTADVALGWARDPAVPSWQGGTVSGIIGPYRDGIKLVARQPQAGLAPLAPPDPNEIPDNHLSYAVQWFLFAATALVIYALALRRRWRATPA